MTHDEKKVNAFLRMSDEELLVFTNVAADTPDSNLAKSVLQHRLSKNISDLNRSSDRYNRLLIILTSSLILIGLEQILVTILPWGRGGLLAFGVCLIGVIYLIYKLSTQYFPRKDYFSDEN